MVQVVEKLQPWLAAIERRPHTGPRWLQDLRDRGATRFAALGFPTVRDEEWRFTNVSPIANTEFIAATDAPAAVEQNLDAVLYGDASNRIVVLNGRFQAQLSRVGALPKGVRVGSLAAAVTDHADVVPRYLGQLADFGTKGFTALNTALAVDGLYVHIPDGVVVSDPLHLVFVAAPTGAAQPIMSNVRALIVAGDRSQVRIVETYVAPGGGTYFTNAVTEVFAGEGA
ncbi:MAG: Fe-S cluster assembly protein SufD, partial [Acidobacteria bacterium]|nr:Fe-S cluster assembly protein SufD [Acidobacteriota bacterium]